MSTYAENRKARHEYTSLETFEGGLALTGAETKSIRDGGAKLAGSYLSIRNGECWVYGLSISAYAKQGSRIGHEPDRPKKVLLHKKELAYLAGKTEQKGLTLIPFSVYASGRRIKLNFGLCRGKQAHDKRDALKERDIQRQFNRFRDDDL